ncbi:MAG TPA: peptidase M35, partial [Polyangia bacterium]|nr:peptidase M35 [Polyangia bacterium]
MLKSAHSLSWLAGGILGFSLLNGCGAVDQPAVESTGSGPEAVASDVVVNLSSAVRSLAAGDDVQVTVTLTNVANHAVSVLRYHTVVDGIQENLFNITRDGAPVQYVGRLYKRVEPQASDYITLGAGQSLTRTVSLAAAYDFSATGRYSVSHAG